MARLSLSSAFSRTFCGLFHGAPNRRARRALGGKAPSTRPAASSRRRMQPCLEILEDRLTPNSTFTPTTFADDPSKGFTLRQAISAFNADNSDPGGGTTDVIQLAAGTYTLSIPNSSGKHEQGNASGDLNINNTNFINPILTIQGAVDANGNPTTIIDQTVADRVFQILNQGGGSEGPETVIFKNLIIEGGVAQDDGDDGVAAGTTDALGGGILDQGGEANVTLSNVLLDGNKAVAATGFNALGGGIYVQGDDQGRGSLTIENNSEFENNVASGGTVSTSTANHPNPGGFAAGGGVYDSNCDLTMSGSILQANFVTGGKANGSTPNDVSAGLAEGGGVYLSANASGDFLSLSNCKLLANKVTGGNASNLGGSGGEALGGGIFANSNSLTIAGCNLSNNKVTGGSASNLGGDGGNAFGGSIDAIGSSLTVSDSQLSDNTLTGGSASAGAGGWAEGGGGRVVGTATLKSSDLSNNTLTGGSGTINSTIGHLSITNDSSPTIITDVGGKAAGGGIFASGATVLTGCTLSGNNLTGGNGTLNNSSASFSGDVGGEALGGGSFVASTSANITTSTLSDNDVTGGNGTYSAGTVAGSVGGAASGGGVYGSAAGSPTFTIDIGDSTLSGNFVFGGNGKGGSATPGFASGGGASIEAGSVTNLFNSTIADNQANGGQTSSNISVAAGGGLFLANSTSANLTNVTVVGNQANTSPTGQGSTSGGGIDNANLVNGQVTLHNTLVALNGANLGPDYDGTVSNTEHNLISVADGSSGFTPLNGDLLGSESHFLNPEIGSLANNGGPTQTIALLANSPAINAGDNNAQSVTGPTDQRGQGFARVSGGTIDIGAYEFQQKASFVIKPPVAAPPSPAPPPLHTPSLLSFFDSLLVGVETVNSDGSVTVTDSIFGIPLLVATYDSNGDLMSVTIFGINVTFLFG